MTLPLTPDDDSELTPQMETRMRGIFLELGALHRALENSLLETVPPPPDGVEPLRGYEVMRRILAHSPAHRATAAHAPAVILPAAPAAAEAPTVPARPAVRAVPRARRRLSTPLVLVLYLAGLCAAETLTTLVDATAGVVLHALVMVALFAHGAVSRDMVRQRMLAALSLAPLIRIISLSLPLQDYIVSYWYLLVGAPMFLSTALVARFSRYQPADLGLVCGAWPVQALIGLTGIGLGLLEYWILRPQPLAAAFTIRQLWAPALILFLFTGLLEEFIFRGMMQKAFIDGLGRWRGLLVVSFLFAVLHIGYQSVLDLAFVFSVAVLFGLVAQRTRSILGVTIAHGLTNVCLFLVFPFFLGV